MHVPQVWCDEESSFYIVSNSGIWGTKHGPSYPSCEEKVLPFNRFMARASCVICLIFFLTFFVSWTCSVLLLYFLCTPLFVSYFLINICSSRDQPLIPPVLSLSQKNWFSRLNQLINDLADSINRPILILWIQSETQLWRQARRDKAGAPGEAQLS